MSKEINGKNITLKTHKINGDLLASSYSVYVTIITHKDKNKFYYVGQTGDAKWISARSPFYRLSAHLGYGESTQNQIYAALKTKLDIKNKQKMELWLSDATIKIHSFKTDDFIFPKNKEKPSKNEEDMHKKKRRKTLALETALIQQLNIGNKSLLLNKTLITWKDWKSQLSDDPTLSDALDILTEICKS